MEKKKSATDILQIVVAILSIIGVISAVIVVPEVRQWIGLDAQETPGEPTPQPEEKLAVFYDDDGSLDGTVALLYLLSREDVDILGITISYGEAHPEVYAQHIGRLLDDLNIIDIPIGAGQDAPLSGHAAFPDWLRELSDVFWTIPLPNPDRTYPVQDAVQLMVSTINQSETPVTLFVTGTLTNLALALQTNPGIRENIAAVYIMGGAVYVPGNILDLDPAANNAVAEWNIYADPQAAKEVLDAGLEIYLVPLDATDQVTINIEDTRMWRSGGKAAGYAADLYDHSFIDYGMKVTEIWDLLAAVVMVKPELCRFQRISLDVVTNQGNSSGQTVVVPDGALNASVCLQPDPDLVRQTLINTFADSP